MNFKPRRNIPESAPTPPRHGGRVNPQESREPPAVTRHSARYPPIASILPTMVGNTSRGNAPCSTPAIITKRAEGRSRRSHVAIVRPRHSAHFTAETSSSGVVDATSRWVRSTSAGPLCHRPDARGIGGSLRAGRRYRSHSLDRPLVAGRHRRRKRNRERRRIPVSGGFRRKAVSVPACQRPKATGHRPWRRSIRPHEFAAWLHLKAVGGQFHLASCETPAA